MGICIRYSGQSNGKVGVYGGVLALAGVNLVTISATRAAKGQARPTNPDLTHLRHDAHHRACIENIYVIQRSGIAI